MKNKFFVFTLVVIMLFAVMAVGADCSGGEGHNTFEEALADVVEKADGKPILIYLSKTN